MDTIELEKQLESKSENTIVEQTETLEQATPKELPEQPPEIQAAMFLQAALPKFNRDLDTVTGMQAKRVLSAITESPLEKTTPAFTTNEAAALFNLGMTIQNAKYILFTGAIKDAFLKILKEKANIEMTMSELSAIIKEYNEKTQAQASVNNETKTSESPSEAKGEEGNG